MFTQIGNDYLNKQKIQRIYKSIYQQTNHINLYKNIYNKKITSQIQIQKHYKIYINLYKIHIHIYINTHHFLTPILAQHLGQQCTACLASSIIQGITAPTIVKANKIPAATLVPAPTSYLTELLTTLQQKLQNKTQDFLELGSTGKFLGKKWSQEGVTQLSSNEGY
ncbi:hypothetical protein PPERSA_02474 [Pseudocohnilembus persalinus]|uniref:Uncharacterized protein n=1 Tax=Pseudocohnilembus persalinus TaxID=266149 RepID=A0A0V0QAZ6_PSEPJ|nr:hypothetical protein PPERSA_02474 [Pseudocohnilembus persalinus]|eukprot:KRW99362.1 hypothetical protein PPERSA_02474 [Pseudocohnilembus persalinus]